MELLKFSAGNAKLKGIFIFSTPAGHFCPFASECLSKANRETGKITDGKETVFRCYAASQEGLFKQVRTNRWRNGELLKKETTLEGLIKLIELSLPVRIGIVRIHESGDFYSQMYFDAWLQVARNNPNIIFYAYTKSLPFWVRRLAEIPSNMRLNASVGGKKDKLIDQYNLKYAKVVASEDEANELGLKVDYTDKLAWEFSESFALVIHGTQPKGSKMGKAVYKNRKEGKHSGYGGSYPRKKVQNIELVLN